MAVVNRFSREPQVAKFDPLSAEEIMKVPIGKQVVEDEQRAAADKQLQEMHNMRSVEGDRERVEARKNELEQRLHSLTNEITTNGISTNTTNQLKNLKREYEKELSSTGEIGQANTYVALKEQARKEFMSNPANMKFGADIANAYWQESTRKRSAFNEDGTYKTEFAGVGMPDYIEAGAEFRDRAKTAGYETVMENGKVIRKSNDAALKAIYNEVMDKYNDPNSKEYRSMIAQGKKPEQIHEELVAAYNASVSNTLGTSAAIAPKMTAAQQKAAVKKGEHYFQRAGTGIKADTGRAPYMTEIKDEEAAVRKEIFNATNENERKDAEDRYNALREKNANYKASFNRTGVGAPLYSELQAAEAAIPKEVATALRDGNVELKAIENGYSIKYLVPKEEAGTTMSDLELASNIDVPKVKRYQEALSRYNAGYDSMVKDDATPDIMVPSYIMKPYDDETKEDWKNYQDNTLSTMKTSKGSFNFESITGLEVNSDGEVSDAGTGEGGDYTTELGGAETNDLMTLLLNDDQAITNFSINALNHQSNLRNMGGIAAITLGKADNLPEGLKNYAGHTVQVRYTLSDSAVAGSKGSEAARSLYTTDLARMGNNDITNFAGINQDRMQYKDMPSPSISKNYDYFNDDDIKEEFSKKIDSNGKMTSKGAALALNGDKEVKVDIYKAKSGRYQFGYATGNGKQIPLTTGKLAELLNNKKITADDKFAVDYFAGYIDKILSANGVPLGPQPGETSVEATARIHKQRGQILRQIEQNGTEPVEFVNDYDFYKLLK